MWGTLRFRLISALIVLPVLVAAVLTVFAIRLVHQDKELYVFDLSSQTADLVARNLSTKIEGLSAQAYLSEKPSPPLLAITRKVAGVTLKKGSVRVDNLSKAADGRLRLFAQRNGEVISMDIAPASLLDLKGYRGPADLTVVNREGIVLVDADAARVNARTSIRSLVDRLGVFKENSARVGTRELDVKGSAKLIAYARVGTQLAVVQSVGKDKVLAAASSLVKNAAVVSSLTVILAVLLALLLSRRIIRPIRAMMQQAEAIARGEFGVSVQSDARGEIARLQRGFNDMSTSLKRREEELKETQHQLLSAERVNTASRMTAAIVNELTYPLEACLSLASHTHRALPEMSNLSSMQRQIVHHANRACGILQNLRRISAQSDSEPRDVEADLPLADATVSARALLEKRALKLDLDVQVSVKVHTRPDQLHNALLDILLFVVHRARPKTFIKIVLREATAEDKKDSHRRPSRKTAEVLLDESGAEQEQETAPLPDRRELLITIEYEGRLLTDKERARLLNPFSAEDASRDSLVLAVATAVVHDDDGRLELDATKKGNRLRIFLPIVTTPPPPA